jgi:hypothetical protein
VTSAARSDSKADYARQDKHWITGPDGQRWENYVVIADAHPELEGKTEVDPARLDSAAEATSGCCGSVQNSHTSAPQQVTAAAPTSAQCC